MSMQRTYLVLCVLGTVLPYSQFGPWLFDHGLDLELLWDELTVNRIERFFVLDVLVSAVAVFALVLSEGRRELRRWWPPVVATLLVGVSLGLPLYLYLRERARTRVMQAN
jgi:uncharacterized protein DUF2834